MQRTALYILTLMLFGINVTSAQDGSGDPFQERIDMLWDLVYSNPDSVHVSAQKLLNDANRIDSYKGRLNAVQLRGEAFYMSNKLDSAYYFYSKALDMAIVAGDRNEIGHTHTSLASISAELGKRQEAIEHFRRSLQVRIDDNDTTEMCDVAVRYANCLGDGDMPTEAMENYVFGLRCCRVVNDELTIGHAYNGMAIVHKKQRNFGKALELLDSAQFYFTKINEEFFLASVLNNRGVLKKELGRYEEAAIDYEEGLTVMEGAGYDRGVMSFNQNLGILANIQNEPDRALVHCGKALEIARKIEIPMTVSEALNEIAKSDLMKGDLQTAESNINEAISVAHGIKSLEKEHQAWETKSQIHKAQGNVDLALQAYQRYVALNDSMFQLAKTTEIDRLQTEYETEKKEKAIAHLQAEAKLDAERRKWLIIGWVAMVVAAIALITGIIMKRRKDRSLHQAQIELKDSENLRLAEQLDHKRRELTEKALHLAQKNELLLSLEEDVQTLKHDQGAEGLKEISNKLRFDKHIDKNWDQFTMAFAETNKAFFKYLSDKHPDVTKNELRLAALLTMNLGSKDLAVILNVSDAGVKKARYRLRKKLELKTEDSLEQYLSAI